VATYGSQEHEALHAAPEWIIAQLSESRGGCYPATISRPFCANSPDASDSGNGRWRHRPPVRRVGLLGSLLEASEPIPAPSRPGPILRSTWAVF